MPLASFGGFVVKPKETMLLKQTTFFLNEPWFAAMIYNNV